MDDYGRGLDPDDYLRMVGVAQTPDVLLLAALLSGSTARRLARAEQVLWRVDGVGELRGLTARRLTELGLGRAEATRVLAALELGRRARDGPEEED